MLGTGALLIFGVSFLLLGFVLDSRALAMTETPVTVSALLLVLIGLERTNRKGFGAWYRVALVLLGAVLFLGAGYNFLLTVRDLPALSGLSWLSVLVW